MRNTAVTVGQLIAQGKHLVLACKTCNTISSKDPSDVFFRPKMELLVLQGMLSCPECGRSNGVDDESGLIVTVE